MDDAAQNNTPNITLSADDLKKLTSQLSSEIDEEIKNQLSNYNQPIQKPIEIKPEENSNNNPPHLENPDPLHASLNSALSSLKEGDKVSEWTIKRVYSTNFGSTHSFFYELENDNGAKWTLNPEEMRELVGSSLKDQPKPDLSPPPIKTRSEVSEVIEKKESEKTLTKEQINFISKLHADPKMWAAFTSLSQDTLANILELYEKGQLTDLGIDAHPLFDKISSKDLGKEVLIKPGDNFNNLVTTAGHTLSYSNKDSVLIGLHILANENLIEETRNKAQAAGLSIEKPPEPKELIKLVKTGLTGNNTAYSKLSQFLNLLPTNSKFRVLGTEEVLSLEKYFAT